MTIDARRRGVRKAHKKSRTGCNNCKLRKVKCDERRPHCDRCSKFGVTCSYDGTGSDLEMPGHGKFQVFDAKPVHSCSQNQTLLGFLNTAVDEEVGLVVRSPRRLTIDDLETLHRFQTRRVRSMSAASSAPMTQEELIVFRSENDSSR